MAEVLRNTRLSMEVQSDGSFEQAELLALQALEAAGIRRSQKGGSTEIAPIENGSSMLKVTISDLEIVTQESA